MKRAVRMIGAAVGVIALALTAGCAGLPQEGAVNVIQQTDRATGAVVLDAKGPTNNASPDELIQGFLRASSVGVSDDYEVARQYLTPEAAARWNPTGSINIYSDTQAVDLSQTSSGSVVVSVPALASLSKNGSYQAAKSGSVMSSEFSLMKNEHGQWRIASLDDAVMMSETVFSSLYKRVPVYYLNTENTALIPDVHWYPADRALSMMCVDVLSGPTGWLHSAAYSAYLGSVEESDISIEVQDSTAVIDLPSGVASLNAKALALLQQQLEKTFVGSGLVQNVLLHVYGVPVEADTHVPDLPTYPLPSSDIVMVRNGSLESLQQGEEAKSTSTPQSHTEGYRSLAVDPRRSHEWIVGVDTSGKRLMRQNSLHADPSVLLNGSDLSVPSMDPYGWVWVVDQASAGMLVAINVATGESARIPTPDIDQATVRGVHVSREGARIVMNIEGEATSQLIAYGIQRDPSGAPQAVGDPLWLGQGFSEVSSVAWVGDAELAILGKVNEETSQGIYSLIVGGQYERLESASDAVALTARGGDTSLAVLNRSGDLMIYSGSNVRKVATGVAAMAYPG